MPDASGSRKHALVVVLGDVTHSPRMTAHVRELLGAGYSVDYAGFVPADIGIQFADDVVKSTVLKILHFKWVRVPSYIFPIAALRNAVRLALRLVLLTLSTLWTCLFCVRKRPHLMIVQSPPALPTFIVMPLVRWWHQCDQYIVDWHNLAFTLMLPPIDLQIDKKDSNTVEPSRELNISRSIYQIVVFIAKGMEIALSKLGTTKHLCVSQHLSTWLAVNVGIKAIVLYDRPDPKFFKRLDQSNAFKFLNKLRSKLGWNGSKKYLTVVSSTSWTPDEDMMLLLDSLMVLDKSLNCSSVMLEVFITGKGPLQAAFELKLSSHTWTTIRIATMWLPYHDYAELLGSADVGVSMHRSSSGLDIPMKIVDMVGAGIPNILSFEYPAISETLDFKVSLFKDSHGLCMLISNIVQAIGNQKLDEKKPLYSTLRMDSQSRNSNKGDWHHHWTNVVKPLLN